MCSNFTNNSVVMYFCRVQMKEWLQTSKTSCFCLFIHFFHSFALHTYLINWELLLRRTWYRLDIFVNSTTLLFHWRTFTASRHVYRIFNSILKLLIVRGVRTSFVISACWPNPFLEHAVQILKQSLHAFFGTLFISSWLRYSQ